MPLFIHSRLLGTVSALCLVPLAAFAQDIVIPENTVFANQTTVAVNRTGATVQVIEGADLAANPQTRLSDYLETLPGVSMNTNGGPGGNNYVRLRGLPQRYTTVLIDGIDVTDPSEPQSQFNWSGVTMGNVGRIEVIKGTQSAIYGADAVAGVISITTTQPKGPGAHFDVAAEIGPNETLRTSLGFSVETERSQLSAGFSRLKTDGFSASDLDDQDEADGFVGTRVNLSFSVEATDRLTLGLAALAADSTGDYDEFGPVDGSEPFNEVSDSQTRALRLFGQWDGDVIDHELSVSTFRIDRVLDSNFGPFEARGKRQSINYLGVYDPSQTYSLSFGADFTREENLNEDFSEIAGVFVEALYAPTDMLDVSLSLRQDDHSRFGAFTSGRASLAWRPREDIIVRAVAANGFRAPSLGELFGSFGGNPDLDPERSQSYELGIEQIYDSGASVRLTAFHTEIDDLIDYVDPDGFGGPIPGGFVQTDGTARTRGFELAAMMPINERVSLSGAYTLTDAEGPDGEPALRVPRHDLVLGVDAQITDRITGGMNIRHVADRPNDSGFEMDDYTLVDATLGYAFNDVTSGYIRVENLTDADYQSSGGYQTQGRAVFFGVTASF